MEPLVEDLMSPRTSFLSRLIGLYLILIALPMAMRREAMVAMVTSLLHDQAMLFVLGVIMLAAGLAMVLAHNIWSGSALAVMVTLIGWLILLKGLLFLFLPPETQAGLFLKELHYDQLFYLYAAISWIIGIYLTYGGFVSKTRS
jgi:hypothetical protein